MVAHRFVDLGHRRMECPLAPPMVDGMSKGERCHQCKTPITGKPVVYEWIPPGRSRAVKLTFCTAKCKVTWLTGDDTGPEGLRRMFRF